MREVAEVHRDLFREHAARYGENVRIKLERCLAVTDDELEEGLRARETYRERCFERLEGVDLLLTPTISFVAPPADTDELTIRDAAIRFTYPFNVLGWPALAIPCGPAENGLPASVQLVGRPGDDALVLAAGEQLEREFARRQSRGESPGSRRRVGDDLRLVKQRADFEPAAERLDEVRHRREVQVVAALLLGHPLVNRVEGLDARTRG